MTDFVPFAPPDAEPFYPDAKAAPAPTALKNYAAEAAIKAGNYRFQQFLAERHELQPPLTMERATQRLRSVLGVSSRTELNNDDAAAERWRALRGGFDAWLRATEPDRRQWSGRTSEDSRRRV
jgi:hypothetical protein